MNSKPLKAILNTKCCKPIKKGVEVILGSMPDSIRFGKEYQDIFRFLKKSEQWSEDRLISYQIQQLKNLLSHAVSTVPFYKGNYKDWGIEIGKIKNLSDLKQIPIMTKETMGDSDKFISDKYKKHMLIHATTGGSSGQTFHFYKHQNHSSKEWAFIINLWNRVSFSNKDWRIVLRGPVVGNPKKGIFWERNPRTKELLLSTYHMNEENMFKYLNIIKDNDYKYLHCHPSSAFVFASFLDNNNIICPLKAVLAASEAVYPFQREILEKVFKCRVYSFYGQSEQVCIAGECEKSKNYHIQPEYGITEILDANGNELKNENEIGEIIATGFINDAMPFIRYRTGDLAVVSNEKCVCGRNHKIIKRIEGRSYEYIVTQDGRVVSLTGLIHGQHFSAFSKMKKMQIHQKCQGEIEIRIVKNRGFNLEDEMEIRMGILNCVNKGIEIKFEYPEEIPLTSRGKHKFLIQEIELEFLKKIHQDISD